MSADQPSALSSARYEHDCDSCVYLGHSGEADVYVCPQSGYPTVVMRYGDEGPEYDSSRELLKSLPGDLRGKATALMDEWASA